MFSLEQILQVVQLSSKSTYHRDLDLKPMAALACHVVRQGYNKESKAYYKVGTVRILLDSIITAIAPVVDYKLNPEDFLVSSPIFQGKLAASLSAKPKDLRDREVEILHFLCGTRESTCYLLSELPGRYLHQLLETECPQKQEDIPEEMVEKMRQLVIDGFDKLFEEDEPITINPLYYTLMKKNNLLDWYTPLDSPQIVSYRDHLVTYKDSAPIDPDKVVAYSRSCPVPVTFVPFIRNKHKRTAIREHLNKYPQVVVVDKSGTVFEEGKTNFTCDSLCDCLSEIGDPVDDSLSIGMVPTIIDRWDSGGGISRWHDGTKRINGLSLTEPIKNSKLPPGVFDSKIFVDGKHRATLRTREY